VSTGGSRKINGVASKPSVRVEPHIARRTTADEDRELEPQQKTRRNASPTHNACCKPTAAGPPQKNRWVVDLRPGRGIIGSVETSQTPKRNGRPVESPSGGRPAEIVGSEEAAVIIEQRAPTRRTLVHRRSLKIRLDRGMIVSQDENKPRAGRGRPRPNQTGREREGPRRRAARVESTTPDSETKRDVGTAAQVCIESSFPQGMGKANGRRLREKQKSGAPHF